MKQLLLIVFFSICLLAGKKLHAQHHINISLRANYENAVAVNSDEPLILMVSVSNKQAQQDERWNMYADRRLDELEGLLQQKKIKKEDHDAEKEQLESAKKTIKTIQLGSAGDPWTNRLSWKIENSLTGLEVLLPVKRLPIPVIGDVAILNERGFYTAFFGIAPGNFKNIAAGIYRLSISIDSSSSNFIQVEVKASNSPDDENTWLSLAKYYWHNDDPKSGLEYTEKVLLSNPKSLEALSLKGDLMLLNKNFKAALENYAAALKEFYLQNPKLPEPPEYLIDMIAWLKEKM